MYVTISWVWNLYRIIAQLGYLFGGNDQMPATNMTLRLDHGLISFLRLASTEGSSLEFHVSSSFPNLEIKSNPMTKTILISASQPFCMITQNYYSLQKP